VTATSDTGTPSVTARAIEPRASASSSSDRYFEPSGAIRRHWIADTVDEPGEALAAQGQLCGSDDGGLPIAGAGEVRRADREAQRMAVIAWRMQYANDRMAIGRPENPVPNPSLDGTDRGFRIGDSAALGA
jgi:hypothetical protein